MIKTYYLLTKPGIILGNLITTTGAFVLASQGHFDYRLFIATAAGLFFVIASACVFNNYIDRDADRKMARTKNRALAQGLISLKSALVFAVGLGIIGIAILALYTNILAVIAAGVGFFVYVALYSFWKYRTEYATWVGSISGAIPPVIGYCAASHRFDLGAFLLFAILVLWQMPHFFSIALFRFQDYSDASIPVWPNAKGIQATKVQMLLFIVAFMVAAFLLTAFGYTGMLYLTAAALFGGAWLLLCIKGFKARDDKVWARQMFRVSLVVVTVLSILFGADAVQSEPERNLSLSERVVNSNPNSPF